MTNKERNNKAKKEIILCIKRNLLPGNWVGQKTIAKPGEKEFFDVCSKTGFQWVERDVAETDPSFKQIIPYIILQTTNMRKTAIYKRHGTEKRLHDLWSCGIGGHINSQDNFNESSSFKQILIAGMERELDEELIQRPENQIPFFAGVINEETTAVGSVHMGVVFRLITDTPTQFVPGDELNEFQWEDTANLDSLNMELWSNLTLELIS